MVVTRHILAENNPGMPLQPGIRPDLTG